MKKSPSPFPNVPCIAHLHGIYSNNGGKLGEKLEKIINAENDDDEKKRKVWDKLREITFGMKKEFNDNINKLAANKAVAPCQMT
jgi:O6-methylguanine-DNA--protein-cysteine methyltransferase